MSGRTIMIQGVASSVGKSLITAALCRIFARRGLTVAPFKAQNMSNNAAVTSTGGEIGRAQYLQAQAAGIEPTVEMNPILLKPEHGSRSQVIVLGHPHARLGAVDYFQQREALWPIVCESLAGLQRQHDLVIIEGAGSPAEVNLRQWDIVNMRVARHVHAPVFLVADIDRGGALAALIGTLSLLRPIERALVKGLVINRFRGDVSLLRGGIEFLEQRTHKPVAGVIPELLDLQLPEEDSASLKSAGARESAFVAAIRLPHVSNFDDLDPLTHAGLNVRWITNPADLRNARMIVLPGTKSTRSDLEFLWSTGLAAAIRGASQNGALIFGICGGFQMLGQQLIDPQGLEGPPGDTPGLGLLHCSTEFIPNKITRQVSGKVSAGIGPLSPIAGTRIHGYEIHDGRTWSIDGISAPAFSLDGAEHSDDGMISGDGRVIGTYVHGILHNPDVVRCIVTNLTDDAQQQAGERGLDQELTRLAEHVEEHLDIALLANEAGIT